MTEMDPRIDSAVAVTAFNAEMATVLRDVLRKDIRSEFPVDGWRLQAAQVYEVVVPALEILLSRPDYHVVRLWPEGGWTLQHPFTDPDLFDCPYTTEMPRLTREIAGQAPGRYRVDKIGNGLVLGEKVEVPEGRMV